MFTREQWKGDFTDCCKPGEEISEELYWNFLNAADPIELNPQSKMCGFQLGEPHDHVPCKDGKMRARYATFGTKVLLPRNFYKRKDGRRRCVALKKQ